MEGVKGGGRESHYFERKGSGRGQVQEEGGRGDGVCMGWGFCNVGRVVRGC